MRINQSKGFTLVELLVAVAIIGILTTIVITSIGSVRERAKITKIQTTLKSIQTNALEYQFNNRTFEGLCNYSDGSVHESIQPQIDSLRDTAGDDRVHCIVRTPDVPYACCGHNNNADNLAAKNFGVAVSYGGENYGADREGIFILDKSPRPSPSVDWYTADQACAGIEKKLPSLEFMAALYFNDTGWGGEIREFIGGSFWTSTESITDSYAYKAVVYTGSVVQRRPKTQNNYYRCVS